ncbi:uncharacterized protein LOC107434161 [Ziziphus jujuba]|uniref:Uncharacterized protein LOC107434161 n=1 Tax=Ziziphus jujuba TaxID=326968 RepID=A0A6P4BE48_ZIZJJ|nr:uncharacterized protein LOC107434161 [Ziziphus jujuba]
MYHPTRGGVRGGRDQFSWDDVKVDKHRENFLGHSIKAPVGRWQKGKDLHWYTRDKTSSSADMEAAKEEIKRVKEQEEQAMREALGLAPKRSSQPQGSRLDKHEFSELVKRGSTAEDVGEGHADAAHVHGLGFSRANRPYMESSSHQPAVKDVLPEVKTVAMPSSSTIKTDEGEAEDEDGRKKRKREEKKQEKHERREKRERHEKHERREKHEKHRSSDDRRKHRKDKERRRHDSD